MNHPSGGGLTAIVIVMFTARGTLAGWDSGSPVSFSASWEPARRSEVFAARFGQEFVLLGYPVLPAVMQITQEFMVVFRDHFARLTEIEGTHSVIKLLNQFYFRVQKPINVGHKAVQVLVGLGLYRC